MKKLLIFLSVFSISIIKSASISEHFAKDGGKEEKENNELSEKEYAERNNTILKCFKDKDIKPSEVQKILKIINQYDNKNSSLIWDPKEDESSVTDPETKKFLVLKQKYANSFEYLTKVLSKKKIPVECVEDVFKFCLSKRYQYVQTLNNPENICGFLKLRNGNFVLYNREIRICRKNNLKYDSILVGRCGYISSLIEMPSGELISGDQFGQIKIWVEKEPDKWECNQTLNDHNNTIITILRLEDNQFISNGHDNTLRIWEKNESGRYDSVQVLRDNGFVEFIFKIKNDLILFSHNPDYNLRILRKNHNDRWKRVQIIELGRNYPFCLMKLNDNSLVYFESPVGLKVLAKVGDKWENIQNIPLARYIGSSTNPYCKIVELKNSNLAFFEYGYFKDAVIFKKNKTNNYEYFQALKGSFLFLIQLNNGNLASFSIDKKVKIWQYSEIKDKYECVQALDVGKILEWSFYCNELQDGSLAIAQFGGKSIQIWDHNNFVDVKSQRNLIIKFHWFLKNNFSWIRSGALSVVFCALLLKRPELRKNPISYFIYGMLLAMTKNPRNFLFLV